MSRSYKKNPFGKGMCNYNSNYSEKKEKIAMSRWNRRTNKHLLRTASIEEMEDLQFENCELFIGWDPRDDVGYKQYFGDYNSCRQATQEHYRWVDWDIYSIETEEDIEIAQEQFNLTDNELKEMKNCVRHQYSYNLRRNIKYEVYKTHEEQIKENQELYKKYLRK